MAAVALPGLQGPLTGSNLADPRKRSAAGQDIRHGSCNFAGWRLRLARPTGASHRLNLAGPRKRSAAGQDIMHGTCIAGWRLSPYPAYRVLSQAQTSQARASAAPPGKISDTVPVISPGGGCRLTRSTGSSHRLIPVGPRKRSAAGQDIRHGTCNFAGWRLSPGPAYRVLLQAHTSQARASEAPPGMGRFTSRLPDGYRTPPSPPPAPLR